MKIALVHYASAPVIGGVERVLEEHARLFAAHGHEVVVLSQHGGGERLPEDPSTLAQAEALRPVLAHADVVFVHNVMTMPFHPGLTQALERLAQEWPHVRFVAWVHDVAACNPDLAPVPEWARRVHPGFTYVAVSKLRQRQWREVSGAESVVIPNGLDSARVLGLPGPVAALAEKFSLLDGRLLLLHPTRLLRRKNVEMSLRIAAALHARGTASTLLISGAADPHHAASAFYAASLREEAQRLDSGALFVHDHFPIGDAELAGLYRLADALLFPSRQEGFGLPLLEAALHRLPIFCSDVEPLPEIAGVHAHLFSPDADPAEVAMALEKKLAADHFRLARQRALAEFSWSALYARHLAPLLKALRS